MQEILRELFFVETFFVDWTLQGKYMLYIQQRYKKVRVIYCLNKSSLKVVRTGQMGPKLANI